MDFLGSVTGSVILGVSLTGSLMTEESLEDSSVLGVSLTGLATGSAVLEEITGVSMTGSEVLEELVPRRAERIADIVRMCFGLDSSSQIYPVFKISIFSLI